MSDRREECCHDVFTQVFDDQGGGGGGGWQDFLITHIVKILQVNSLLIFAQEI